MTVVLTHVFKLLRFFHWYFYKPNVITLRSAYVVWLSSVCDVVARYAESWTFPQ